MRKCVVYAVNAEMLLLYRIVGGRTNAKQNILNKVRRLLGVSL